MRSISDPATTFFIDELLPVAEKLAAAGKTFFARAPAAEAATYFVTPRRRRATKEALRTAGADAAGVLGALHELWSGDGDDELLGLIPALQSLSREPALEAEREGAAAVDPFGYVLF